MANIAATFTNYLISNPHKGIFKQSSEIAQPTGWYGRPLVRIVLGKMAASIKLFAISNSTSFPRPLYRRALALVYQKERVTFVKLTEEGAKMKKIAYLYVCDTMADWEPSYVISELHSGRYFKDKTLKYEVRTVSLTQDPITTMGGLKILPDLSVHQLRTHEAGVLILPGGDTWLEPIHTPIFNTVREFLHAHIPVAAICGATFGLAVHDFLNNCQHTSNDREYLKAICPTYRGESFYLQQPAVIDGDLITASGIAPLDFAYAILNKLEVFLPATLEAWYKLYQTHEAKYFFALMGSLPQVV